MIPCRSFVIASMALFGATDSERPAWRAESSVLSSSLSGIRIGPRAVALPDGSALIIGGGPDTIEQFDPATRRFTVLDIRLSRRRLWPTVTLLADGRVLIAGGARHKKFGDTAEVFDPKTGTLSEPIRLKRVRVQHTATRLADGRVLLAGGDNTAEIFDPKTLTTAGPYRLAARRLGHTSTPLPDGCILLAGGGRNIHGRPRADGYRSAELFDVKTMNSKLIDTFMHDERDEHIALSLPDGRVLLAGGQRRSDHKTHVHSDIYDPATTTFTSGPDLPTDCQDTQVIELGHGRALILGGESDDGRGGKADVILDQILGFDPATMRFIPLGRLKVPRDDFAACRLIDGRILVAGGLTRGDVPTLSAELVTVHEGG